MDPLLFVELPNSYPLMRAVYFKLYLCSGFFRAELCLTSNVKGRTVKSYEDHHFKDWRNHDHPVVICVS